MTKEEKSLHYYLERKSSVKEYKRLSWTKNRSEKEKESLFGKKGCLEVGGNTDALILESRL